MNRLKRREGSLFDRIEAGALTSHICQVVANTGVNRLSRELRAIPKRFVRAVGPFTKENVYLVTSLCSNYKSMGPARGERPFDVPFLGRKTLCLSATKAGPLSPSMLSPGQKK